MISQEQVQDTVLARRSYLTPPAWLRALRRQRPAPCSLAGGWSATYSVESCWTARGTTSSWEQRVTAAAPPGALTRLLHVCLLCRSF